MSKSILLVVFFVLLFIMLFILSPDKPSDPLLHPVEYWGVLMEKMEISV